MRTRIAATIAGFALLLATAALPDAKAGEPRSICDVSATPAASCPAAILPGMMPGRDGAAEHRRAGAVL